VYCRSQYHRNQLDIPAEAGLVMEIKRNNYRIFFENKKLCWLPRETIIFVDGKINLETIAGRLHHLMQALNPLDCELISEGNIHRATFRIDHIDNQLVDELKDFLGSDFVSMSVVPEGMAFMLADIKFMD